MEMRPVLLAAAEAALEEMRHARDHRPRLPARRALLVGAGAVTAWRLAMRWRGGSVLEEIEDRLLEYEERHFGDDEHFDDPEEIDEDEDFDENEDSEEDDDLDEDEDDLDAEAEPDDEAEDDVDAEDDLDTEAEPTSASRR